MNRWLLISLSANIDLYVPFADEKGLLKSDYTNDDLHIKGGAIANGWRSFSPIS
ncbi:MAG: hypothetical protein AAFP89_08640 [Bacteroidota bacterium]